MTRLNESGICYIEQGQMRLEQHLGRIRRALKAFFFFLFADLLYQKVSEHRLFQPTENIQWK